MYPSATRRKTTPPPPPYRRPVPCSPPSRPCGLARRPRPGGGRRRRLDGPDGLEQLRRRPVQLQLHREPRWHGRGRHGRRQPRPGAADPRRLRRRRLHHRRRPARPAHQGQEVRRRRRLGRTPTAAASSIQPGKTAQVPFTVSVPDNATPGDYVGGILTSLEQADQAEGINVDRRLGIRIKLRVGGELKPNLAIEDLHVDVRRHAPTRSARATPPSPTRSTTPATPPCPASRRCRSRARSAGCGRGPADIAAPPELLPGESWKVTVPVHGVAPAGPAGRDRDAHAPAHRRVGLHHPAQAGRGHRARLGRAVDAVLLLVVLIAARRRGVPAIAAATGPAQGARGGPRAGRRRAGAPRPGAARRPDAPTAGSPWWRDPARGPAVAQPRARVRVRPTANAKRRPPAPPPARMPRSGPVRSTTVPSTAPTTSPASRPSAAHVGEPVRVEDRDAGPARSASRSGRWSTHPGRRQPR